ncbi:MAG: 3-deoxy-7-phosphoheptulonate synthase [Planctomycetota bacterium]|nr:MAG: 3-deoxy-7-phosphoheptulonate synthase [Planctomycetota bacterium]
MLHQTDDIRIRQLKPLIPPAILMEEYPLSEAGSATIAGSRAGIVDCLRGKDQRLVVVVGPCSIHDPEAAVAYAEGLSEQAQRLGEDLLIVMRVYFEKPRTIVGWKGLINDPHLDGSYAINEGLRAARKLLCRITELGLPSGTEFLDTITPQFIGDLISWGAIGARTTESQVHRELASGLSVPVGFKNGTDGNINIALDAIRAAAHEHCFLSVTKNGLSAIVATHGNPDCHVILRGGSKGPNFGRDIVASIAAQLEAMSLVPRVMVDCSHGNSGKDPRRQPEVVASIAKDIADGANDIFGVMIESHLLAGRQDLKPNQPLIYGQSITDACLGWTDTVPVLEHLAQAVAKARRRNHPQSP